MPDRLDAALEALRQIRPKHDGFSLFAEVHQSEYNPDGSKDK